MHCQFRGRWYSGALLPDLEQGITELLDSLGCNLVVLDGSKYNVPEVFQWIYVRLAWHLVSGSSAFA